MHTEQPLLQLAVRGELGSRQQAGDAPVHHHGDVVGDVERHAEVLLDQQHRDVAVVGKRLQHADDLLDDDRRQTFRRLVHHQHPRVEQQRTRDREHLLLASGQLRAAIAAALGQPREQLVDALGRPRAAPTAGRDAQSARRR